MLPAFDTLVRVILCVNTNSDMRIRHSLQIHHLTSDRIGKIGRFLWPLRFYGINFSW